MITFNTETDQFENLPAGTTVLDLTLHQILLTKQYSQHFLAIGLFAIWSKNRSELTSLVLKTYLGDERFSETNEISDINIFVRACDVLSKFIFDDVLPPREINEIEPWDISLRYYFSMPENRVSLKDLHDYFLWFDENAFRNAKVELKQNPALGQKDKAKLERTFEVWIGVCQAIKFLRMPIEDLYHELKAIEHIPNPHLASTMSIVSREHYLN